MATPAGHVGSLPEAAGSNRGVAHAIADDGQRSSTPRGDMDE